MSVRDVVALRDARIRALEIALQGCVTVMGKCAPYAWGRSMQELPSADDQQEGVRLCLLSTEFTTAYRAGKDALKT